MLEMINMEIDNDDMKLTLTINGKDYHSSYSYQYNEYVGVYQYIPREKLDIGFKINKDFSYLERFMVDAFVQKCISNRFLKDAIIQKYIPDEDFETLQEEWSILEQSNEIFKDIYNIQMHKNRIDNKDELYTFG